MSSKIKITATDGHKLNAWRSDPSDKVIGGIVILHAIYGLTKHMGDVCDIWAKQGFSAIAPALYDRIERNLIHPYGPEGGKAGIETYGTLTRDQILADVGGCVTALRPGPVAVSGFCTGGSWAWVASQMLEVDASVNFYGSHVHQWLEFTPNCPTIMHYGDCDRVVPLSGIENIQTANPGLTVYIYPGADHAFFNPEQDWHDPEASELALHRSVKFLETCFTGINI